MRGEGLEDDIATAEHDGEVAPIARPLTLQDLVGRTALDVGASIKLIEIAGPVGVAANFNGLVAGGMLDTAQ